MAYVIALPCVKTKDAACILVCPCDCIHPTPDEPGFAEADHLHIDPDLCIDCGLCAEECPVKAIFPEQDLPDEWKDFIDRNAAYYKVDSKGG